MSYFSSSIPLLELVINSYRNLLCEIGGGALGIFLLGSWLIIRLHQRPTLSHLSSQSSSLSTAISPPAVIDDLTTRQTSLTTTDISAETISAIAGNEPILAQLDLARAYYEAGATTLAKTILQTILEQKTGTAQQQQTAARLLAEMPSDRH